MLYELMRLQGGETLLDVFHICRCQYCMFCRKLDEKFLVIRANKLQRKSMYIVKLVKRLFSNIVNGLFSPPGCPAGTAGVFVLMDGGIAQVPLSFPVVPARLRPRARPILSAVKINLIYNDTRYKHVRKQRHGDSAQTKSQCRRVFIRPAWPAERTQQRVCEWVNK